MARSCSQTHKVAFLGLMTESPSGLDHSRIHSTQNTRENGNTGAQLGADSRAWKGNGLSPAPAGQRREVQSQPRSRLLDPGNTMKVTYPICCQQAPGPVLSEGRLWLSFILFLKFLSCHVLVLKKKKGKSKIGQ